MSQAELLQKHLDSVVRTVNKVPQSRTPVRALTLARTFDADRRTLWDAITNPSRIAQYFAPVTGDIRLGGHFHIESYAGGEIDWCDPPHLLRLNWDIGGDVSRVELTLHPILWEDGGDAGRPRTRLVLRHDCNVQDHYVMYGAGAMGSMWEMVFVALSMHLADDRGEIDRELMASEAFEDFLDMAGDKWGRAAVAGGEREDVARAGVAETSAFWGESY